MVFYEITAADEDEANAKLDKLNRAAKRIGLPRGFVDMAGPVPLDESGTP